MEDDLPANFFDIMAYFLDDIGFAIVLHSRDLKHMVAIRQTKTSRKLIHVWKLTIHFASPLFDIQRGLEVR